ncbi:tRNA-dihydrouridine synthase [Gaoshiqia sp. Z1-71]|uniref:tRNA-dihydrouridine synthase n=1 Tax=Gaoshiqia hydrogeniformans TaxID=3290090 RepID=UPI003BF7D696
MSQSFLLAPLQGFTDFVFRKCYHQTFGNIAEYYIPYLTVGPGNKIRNSQYRDILPENNAGVPVVPQVLCGSPAELRQLADILKNFGYKKINLNLGCPYPMATNRGKGTGLLERKDELRQVLDVLFEEYDFSVSVKFRSGLASEQTIFERIELLTAYPFEKLIFHPRTARQLYKGKANRNLFADLSAIIQRPLVYNGDIQTADDLEEIRLLAPQQQVWMIGRGVLTDPFLVDKLLGKNPDPQKQAEIKEAFHRQILENYLRAFTNEGQALMKMKQFWSYFSESFPNPHKTWKPIKKASKLSSFLTVYPANFRN